MNRVKFALLAAGFAFALALTFSCSQDDEDIGRDNYGVCIICSSPNDNESCFWESFLTRSECESNGGSFCRFDSDCVQWCNDPDCGSVVVSSSSIVSSSSVVSSSSSSSIGSSSSSNTTSGYCLYSGNCYTATQSQCSTLSGTFYLTISACMNAVNGSDIGYCYIASSCSMYYKSNCIALGGKFYATQSECWNSCKIMCD